MTTRVLVTANHGDTGETHVHVERRGAGGHFERDDASIVLKGPHQWHEVWLPDDGQVIVSEKR